MLAPMKVTVECYAGYRADERPQRFALGGKVFEVEEIVDRWYSPGALYFRVAASDGNLYVLCHNCRNESGDGEWTLEAFRRVPRPA